jgi:hypothetical protein
MAGLHDNRLILTKVLHGLIFLLRELMACPVALDTTQVLLEGDGNAKIGMRCY